MPTVRRQTEMALVRDTAVQKLRDLTIAVALASAAAVALIAWVSAATIPGIAGVHIMAPGNEAAIADVIKGAAGLKRAK